MATILTKEVKDVHLEHSSGHTPAQLKAFSQLFVEPQSNNLPILKIGRLVPEPTKLGY